jgi:hypothetical protein
VAGTAGLHCCPDLNDGSCSRRRRCRRSSFQRYSDGSAGSSSVEQSDDCRTGTPRSQRRPAATLLRVWLGDPGAENDPLFLGFVSFCLSRDCLDTLLSLFNGTVKIFKKNALCVFRQEDAFTQEECAAFRTAMDRCVSSATLCLALTCLRSRLSLACCNKPESGI